MSIIAALGSGRSIKIEAQVSLEEKRVTFAFRGVLEEEKPLDAVAEYLNGMRQTIEEVVFDLSGVERINSSGVRCWLDFMKRIQGYPFRFRFGGVSEFFLEQANAKPWMLGKRPLPIDSFEAPYFCETCSSRTVRTLRTAELDLKAEPFRAPSASCESCGKPMRLDESEEYFFQFLKRLSSLR
ncbi:MAG: hypothetical protein NDJ89_01200 [Oligoflexia bacterium]|nr:hypothetical protein [Oligoflexia bacterium]